MPKPDTRKIEKSLVVAMSRRMPKSLFRYYGVAGDRLEWVRGLIQDSDVYFSRSSQFNDPLDCRIAPRFGGSSLKRLTILRRLVPRSATTDSPQAYRKRIGELVAQSRTEAGCRTLSESVFHTLDKQGILCLSTQPDSTLMWAYYSEGHQGICVRFNMSLDLIQDAIRGDFFLVEVKYTTDFPRIQFYLDEEEERIVSMVGTKSKAWEHEKEWRVIARQRTGSVRFAPRFVDGVILGLKTPRTVEDQIRAWIAARAAPIELLRIQNKPESFELEVVGT